MLFEGLPEQAEIAGVRIEYDRRGVGRPMLCLHGCDGVDLGDGFVSEMAQHFDVISPSLPGFGSSDLPRHFRDIDDLVDFCARLVEHFDLRDAVLVGSSFGGWVAAELASRCTGRFSHLVLADALGARFSRQPDEVEIFDVFTVPTEQIPSVYCADTEKGMQAFRGLNFAELPEAAALRSCRSREALTLFGWSPLLVNPALRNRLPLIDIPTLVVWGAEDKVVSTEYGRKYAAAIPGAAFAVVPRGGHYLTVDQPAEFARHVLAFTAAAAPVAA